VSDEKPAFTIHPAVTLTAHEAAIAAKHKAAVEKVTAAKSVIDKLARARQVREAIHDAHEAAQGANPTGRQYAVNGKRYRAHGRESQLFDAALAKLGPIEKDVRAQVAYLRNEVAKIGDERRRQFEGMARGHGEEQRTALRAMKPEDRAAALSMLVRSGEPELVFAVIGKGGDEISLGISGDFLRTLRRTASERFDADGVKLEAELDSMANAVEQAINDHGRWLQGFGAIVAAPEVKAAALVQTKLDELAKV
jgi:hypothetical protein